MTPATDTLGPIIVDTTRGAGVTAAAATGTCPPLIRRAFYTRQKPYPCGIRHSGSRRPAFADCGRFAPAAPRRAGPLVSVALWGLPLPRPLPIIGLGGHYPPNNLMGRRPILGRVQTAWVCTPFGAEPFQASAPMGDYPQFPGVIPLPRVGCRRVTQPCAGMDQPPSQTCMA